MGPILQKQEVQMHKGDLVKQKVNESQIKVQNVYGLPGYEVDPQQSDDHWLSDQKQNDVNQSQNMQPVFRNL